MKIINIIINAIIEIVITSVGLGLLGGFGYILYTSNALADSANLMPYLNSFSVDSVPMHFMAIAVIGVAIALHLLKATVDQDGPRFAA